MFRKRDKLSVDRMLFLENILLEPCPAKIEGLTKGEKLYLSRAQVMPYAEIHAILLKYDKASPRMDELAFLNDLCTRYHQPRASVIQRIQEVRKISKRKAHTL